MVILNSVPKTKIKETKVKKKAKIFSLKDSFSKFYDIEFTAFKIIIIFISLIITLETLFNISLKLKRNKSIAKTSTMLVYSKKVIIN
jgi:hypothetical protein